MYVYILRSVGLSSLSFKKKKKQTSWVIYKKQLKRTLFKSPIIKLASIKKNGHMKIDQDGISEFVFGWDPHGRPGLLSNHFLNSGVDFFWRVTLHNSSKIFAKLLL